MTTKKIGDTKPSSARVPAPGKDLAELATVSRDVAEREQAERNELEKRCRHLGKVVEESAATIRVLREQLKLESNERKRAERDIRTALKYAENIIATVPLSFLILNAGLRVISANRYFYDSFKVTPEETVGQLVYDLGNRQWNIPELRDLLELILPEHTTIEGFKMEHDFPDLGRRVMVLNARRVYWNHDESPLILLVIEDATQRKLMQEKLLASERLVTLGQISGNISHELRNPLGVIASSVYYLKSALKGNDHKVEQHLERIKNNVDSAVAIIDSLFNLTWLKPPQLERLDLTAIICDAITSAEVPPTVSLVRDFPEQGLLVDADRVQLPMCFKNIVKNAVEAMEGTGTLTVTGHRTADGQAEISFADTGPGIPTDNLTNIFQPLFSTKAKGIGFGLSIAKMIVERHGGIIEAKSEPGKGANIIIRLPLEAKQHKEDKLV